MLATAAVLLLLAPSCRAFNPYASREAGVLRQIEERRAAELIRAHKGAAAELLSSILTSDAAMSRRLQSDSDCASSPTAECCAAFEAAQEHLSTAPECDPVAHYIGAVFNDGADAPSPAVLSSVLPGICEGACIADLLDTLAPVAGAEDNAEGCHDAKMMRGIVEMVCSKKDDSWCLAEYVDILSTGREAGGPTQTQLDAICKSPCLPEVYTFATAFLRDGASSPPASGRDSDGDCESYQTTAHVSLEILSGGNARAINGHSEEIWEYLERAFGDDSPPEEECDGGQFVSADLRVPVVGPSAAELEAVKWDVLENVAAHFDDPDEEDCEEVSVEISWEIEGVEAQRLQDEADAILENLAANFGEDRGDGGDGDGCDSEHTGLIIEFSVSNADADAIEEHADEIWEELESRLDEDGGDGGDECEEVHLTIRATVDGVTAREINAHSQQIAVQLLSNFNEDESGCTESWVTVWVPVEGTTAASVRGHSDDIRSNLINAFADGEAGAVAQDADDVYVGAYVTDDNRLFVIAELRLCAEEADELAEVLNRADSISKIQRSISAGTGDSVTVDGNIEVAVHTELDVSGIVRDDGTVSLVVELYTCADAVAEIELRLATDEAWALIGQSVGTATGNDVTVTDVDFSSDDLHDRRLQKSSARRLQEEDEVSIHASVGDHGRVFVEMYVPWVCEDDIEWIEEFLATDDAQHIFQESFREALDNEDLTITSALLVREEGGGRRRAQSDDETASVSIIDTGGAIYVTVHVPYMCTDRANELSRQLVTEEGIWLARIAIAEAVDVDEDSIQLGPPEVKLSDSGLRRRLLGARRLQDDLDVTVEDHGSSVVFVVHLPHLCEADVDWLRELYNSEWGHFVLVESMAWALDIDVDDLVVGEVEVEITGTHSRRLGGLQQRMLQSGLPNLSAYYDDSGNLWVTIVLFDMCEASLQDLEFLLNNDDVKGIFVEAFAEAAGVDVEIGEITVTAVNDNDPTGGDTARSVPDVDVLCSTDADGAYCMLEDLSFSTDGQTLPPMQEVCTGCGRNILRHVIETVLENRPAQAAVFSALMEFGCGTNANGERCGDLLEAFFGYLRRLRGRQLDGSAALEAFAQILGTCGDATAEDWGPECPAGCSDALEAMQSAAGCCFYGAFDMQMLVLQAGGVTRGGWDVDTVFEKVESACNVQFDRICTAGASVSRSMQILGIKFSYVNAHEGVQVGIKTAWVSMMATKFGTSTATFEVVTLRDVPSKGIVVDYKVHAQSDEEMQSLVAAIEAAESEGLFDMSGIDALIPHSDDARYDSDGGISAQGTDPTPPAVDSGAARGVVAALACVVAVLAAAVTV